MSQKNAIWKGSHNPRTWGLAKQPLLSTTCINESWDDPTLQVSADPAERWDTKRLNDFQTFNLPLWKLRYSLKIDGLEDESSS